MKYLIATDNDSSLSPYEFIDGEPIYYNDLKTAEDSMFENVFRDVSNIYITMAHMIQDDVPNDVKNNYIEDLNLHLMAHYFVCSVDEYRKANLNVSTT